MATPRVSESVLTAGGLCIDGEGQEQRSNPNQASRDVRQRGKTKSSTGSHFHLCVLVRHFDCGRCGRTAMTTASANPENLINPGFRRSRELLTGKKSQAGSPPTESQSRQSSAFACHPQSNQAWSPSAPWSFLLLKTPIRRALVLAHQRRCCPRHDNRLYWLRNGRRRSFRTVDVARTIERKEEGRCPFSPDVS